MVRRAQFILATLALTLTTASCALSSEPTLRLPSVWKLSMGGGGGIAAAYSATGIDSTGRILFSGWSIYPKAKDTQAAQLSKKELEHFTTLLIAAYPHSREGKTEPRSFYTWFDITLDDGSIRSFHAPHSPKVKHLAKQIEVLKELHRPAKEIRA